MNVVLALDPSGNFVEGKGTTGWCVSNDKRIVMAGQISSAEYRSQMEYWTAVIGLIRRQIEFCKQGDSLTVVCEDYRLYASKSDAQINSNLETPQLIGAIKWYCYVCKVPCVLQMAAEVVQRWSNEVLLAQDIVTYDRSRKCYTINGIMFRNHSLDALRHCIHYNTFKADPVVQKKKSFYKGEYENYDRP